MSEEYIGEPSEDVPKKDPGEDCNGKRTSNGIFKGYCQNVAGKGTDHLHDGRCYLHGGKNSSENGQGAPEENTNSVTHGIHADTNAVYQKVFSEHIKRVVDDIYEDYIKKYEELHGKPPFGHEAELFRIAVSYGKHLHSEEWAVEKPESLDAGNALVDRETKVSESGERYYKYKQTVVQKGQQSLSRDRRGWLKDLGLLDTNPDSQQADQMGSLAAAIKKASGEN